MTLNTYIRLNENLRSHEAYSKTIAKAAHKVLETVRAGSKLVLLSFEPRDLYWGNLQAATSWRKCFMPGNALDSQRLENESQVAVQIEPGLAKYLVPESQVTDFEFECEN